MALRHTADGNHGPAKTCADRLAADRLPLFVSIVTIAETHNRLTNVAGGREANRFLESVFDGSVNLLRPDADDETAARLLVGRYSYLPLSFADALNMTLMARHGIAVAFSFDRDFLEAGFLRIPPWEAAYR